MIEHDYFFVHQYYVKLFFEQMEMIEQFEKKNHIQIDGHHFRDRESGGGGGYPPPKIENSPLLGAKRKRFF